MVEMTPPPDETPPKGQRGRFRLTTFHWLIITMLVGAGCFMAGVRSLEWMILTTNGVDRRLIRAPITPAPTEHQIHNRCQKYGKRPKSEYLIGYTVKKGDTLLSVAKKELGNASRVNELIMLNKEQYPSLSLNSPFLEQDWVLYLPQPTMPQLHSDIVMYSGELGALPGTLDAWYHLYQPLGTMFFIPSNETVYVNTTKDTLALGDCLSVIKGADISDKVLSIIKE